MSYKLEINNFTEICRKIAKFSYVKKQFKTLTGMAVHVEKNDLKLMSAEYSLM